MAYLTSLDNSAASDTLDLQGNPKNVKEAKAFSYWLRWKEVMDCEYKSLKHT